MVCVCVCVSGGEDGKMSVMTLITFLIHPSCESVD